MSIWVNITKKKNDIDYDQLLSVVKDVMDDYPEWTWNGQRWYQ